MKALILVLGLTALVLGGCFLNPDEPAKVVHTKWETRTTAHATYHTATFCNKGDKDAKNVRVKLQRPDGTGGDGYTEPELLAPGREGLASLYKRSQDHHAAGANKVLWIKWDD